MALVDLSVVEQRYRVVLEVRAGARVGEVAARVGVSRQTVHEWLRRYRDEGLAGLADRSRRPLACPHQVGAEIEVEVCETRRVHPGWGAKRIAYELARRRGGELVVAPMTVHRVLVRSGLLPRSEAAPTAAGVSAVGAGHADGRCGSSTSSAAYFSSTAVRFKVVTGVDDHSRFCVLASAVARATGRAVCLAFAAALRRFGVPEEVLTDNGKQFTARFGAGGEVLFDRICRDNGIAHRLTQPSSPTTTGKVERFHQTLRRELLHDHPPFAERRRGAGGAGLSGCRSTTPSDRIRR